MGWINYITSEVNAMRCIDPTFAHVEYIADNLREQDRLEVYYSNGLTGFEAVLTSWKYSAERHCLEGDDGIPCAVCGVNEGIIWMLGTDSLTGTSNHKKQLVRFGKAWIDELIAGGEKLLHNWALSSNTKNIKFLKHLGFEMDKPAPMGRSGQLFNHFWREA